MDSIFIQSADFPIFYIECISERHVVIAGGGGSSKTGVHNQINILELIPSDDCCHAELVMKYKTPDDIPDAIMTGSLFRDSSVVSVRLLTGGTNAVIYKFNFDLDEKCFKPAMYEILKDEHSKSEIKSVKYNSGKIFTGSVDGMLSIWASNDDNITKISKKSAHKEEISELDVDPINQQITTLSRDESRCVVWNLKDLKMIHEFKKDSLNDKPRTGASEACFKYSFRSCRYAYDSINTSVKDSNTSILLIACNPIPAKGPSKIFKWRPDDFNKFTSFPVTHDGIMAMNVSLDGKFVAIGTRSGSVSVLETNNFNRIHHIENAHHNAVTNVTFLPPNQESLNLTNSKVCPLLSVSIDRRIVLHTPGRKSMKPFLKASSMLIILYVSFVALQSLWQTYRVAD